MSNLSYTVVITTNHGEWHLVEAIRSMRASTGLGDFPLIVVADSVPVSLDVKLVLDQMKVVLIENSVPTSAFVKQKQVLEYCDTDLILLTQDDVLVDPECFEKIIRTFEQRPDVTFVGVQNVPLETGNWFSKVLNVGTRMSNHIGMMWRGGDNYLAMLGRMMAFRTRWLKRMYVENDSVSLDAYLYFENKQMGGRYVCLWDAPLYFLNPQNFVEHFRKSSRFRNSLHEMKTYRRFPHLEWEYAIPTECVRTALWTEFKRNPLTLLGYVLVSGVIWLTKQRPEICLTPLWKVDFSTKRIMYGG